MNEKKKCYKTFKSLVLKIIFLSIIAYLIFNYVIGMKYVNGISTYPNIKDGDLIVYSRLDNSYNIDEVIVYEDNSVDKLGRIVAVSGDEVDFSEDGELKVNGNIQNEDLFYPTFSTNKDIEYPVLVEENSYFVLSDNRIQGVDSRMTGDIKKKNIKGKVISILRIRGI